MERYEEFYEWIFDHLKRIVFPEEWLAADVAMSKQELFTLMTVGRLKEATMGQLSDQMNFPMSTATGIVDRLVKKGYIDRGRSESDRRSVVVSLTEKGDEFVGKMKSMILSYSKRAYDALDESEREAIFRIAGKISAAFQQHDEKAEKDKKEKSQVRKITIE